MTVKMVVWISSVEREKKKKKKENSHKELMNKRDKETRENINAGNGWYNCTILDFTG